jgi:hypothetical protein
MPNHYEPIFNVQTPKVLQKPEVHVLCVCNEIYNNDTKVEPVHKFSVQTCVPQRIKLIATSLTQKLLPTENGPF